MKRTLQIHPSDNTVVALEDIPAGETIQVNGCELTVVEDVRFGHKIAIAPIVAGEQVTKYGASIGLATQPIAAGEHVHTHNLVSVRGSAAS